MAVVWQISAIQFGKRTVIRGIILKNISWPDHIKTTKLKNFYLVISSYFRKKYKNQKVIVSTERTEVEGKTDNHGIFTVVVNEKEINKIEILNSKTRIYRPVSNAETP